MRPDPDQASGVAVRRLPRAVAMFGAARTFRGSRASHRRARRDGRPGPPLFRPQLPTNAGHRSDAPLPRPIPRSEPSVCARMRGRPPRLQCIPDEDSAMKDHYYLDNASTTWPKPEPVYRFMDSFFRSHGVNPGRAGHTLANEAEQMIFETRRLLAQFFGYRGGPQPGGVHPERHRFAEHRAVRPPSAKATHVVTTRVEHNSVLRPLYHLERDCAVRVARVGADAEGYVDPGAIRDALDPLTPGSGGKPWLERARIGPGSRRDRGGRSRGRSRLRRRHRPERGRHPHRHGRARYRRPVLHRTQGPVRADGDRGG